MYNMDLKLNDEWIKKFEENDKLYQDFYKDDLYYINTHFVYINKTNEIEKIKQESFLMTTRNCISREELIGMVKRNSIDNSQEYSILSILKYNITLDVEDVKGFLSKSSKYDHFLTTIKNIDAITFDKTVNMFQDLNDLIFIFYIKPTKNINNATKKVFLTSNHKRTVRK
jgi:hypothetical protein